MISSIAQRIGKFIAYQQMSRREFASRLGYTSSEKINRLFRKDGAKPGFDIIADISNKFVGLNVEWLVTGRGEMLKGEPAFAASPESAVFVSLKNREGYTRGYDKPEYIRKLPVFSFPGLSSGTYRMFEVGGSGLYPVLQDRDWIVGRWSTPEDVSEDQVSVILSRSQGLIIRRVGRRDGGHLWIKANPLQRDEFPAFRLPEGDVLEVWEMAFAVTRHLSELSGIRVQLAELEASVQAMEERLRQKGI